MSKISLLEIYHGEKKYKEILFPVPDGSILLRKSKVETIV